MNYTQLGQIESFNEVNSTFNKIKNIILSVAVISFILVSCNYKSKQDETTNSVINKPETATKKVNQSSFSIKEIVATYLS